MARPSEARPSTDQPDTATELAALRQEVGALREALLGREGRPLTGPSDPEAPLDSGASSRTPARTRVDSIPCDRRSSHVTAQQPGSDPSSAAPEIEHLVEEGEGRSFPPSAGFRAQANATADLYLEADEDFEAFWERLARERITWRTPFKRTLEWDLPFAKWFTGGTLNVSENCIDRHVAAGLGDKVAYHWIGEPGDTRTITYADLLREVQKAANALKELGVGTGDRVAIYMPMIPELPIAMLACARIGAPHTVVFGGFSAESLAGRIEDSQAKLIITADGGWRRGDPVDLKAAADEAALVEPDHRAPARGPARG